MDNTEIINCLIQIQEQHRRRKDYMRNKNNAVRSCRAICRRICSNDKTEGRKLYAALKKGDHEHVAYALLYLEPMLNCIEILNKAKLASENDVKKLTRKLPIWQQWAVDITGLGELGLGQLIGELAPIGTIPDFRNFATKEKVWKRYGVGLVDGRAQHKTTNAEMALKHGYSPHRRSIVYCIGVSLITRPCFYREIYDKRRAYLEEKGDGRIHTNAQRYMEKRLLKDVWRAWHKTMPILDATDGVKL